MRVLYALALLFNLYLIVYYRMLVRFFYERHHNVKESTFGALFSFPPYGALPDKGKKYARRYWVAVVVFVTAVLIAGYLSDYSGLGDIKWN